MPVINFHCPACQAKLRLNDRTLVGRTLDCPECEQALELFEDEQARIQVRRISPSSAKSTQSEERSPEPSSETSDGETKARPIIKRHLKERLATLAKPLQTPLGIAWCLAIALTTLFILVAIVPEISGPDRPRTKKLSQADTNPKTSEIDAANKTNPAQSVTPNKQPDNTGRSTTPAATGNTNTNTISKNNPVEDENNEPPTPPVKTANIATGDQQSPNNLAGNVATDPHFPDTVAKTNTDKPNRIEKIDKPPSVPEPTVDIDAILKLPILKFEQKSPVTLPRILLQVQNLAGIEFDTSPLANADVEWESREVTVDVENTTFRLLLEAILDQADARMEVIEDTITIHPKMKTDVATRPSN